MTGHVKNCELIPREGEILFTVTEDGKITPTLDGYIIAPKEKYRVVPL